MNMNSLLRRRALAVATALVAAFPAALPAGCPAATPTPLCPSARDKWKGLDLTPYRQMDDVAHSQVPQAALQFIPRLADKVESITVLTTTARKPARRFEELRDSLESNADYENLGSTKKGDYALFTYGHRSGEQFVEVVCFLQADRTSTVLQIRGTLAEEDIAGVAKLFL